MYVWIKNFFRVVSSAATREHDKYHILKYLDEDVSFKDVTEDICCLGLFGPKSREMISKISNDDFSNDQFKFGTGKFIMINGVKVWAQRLSYVGELGFELYVDSSLAKDLYEILIEEGKKLRTISLWNACNGYYENGKWICSLGT